MLFNAVEKTAVVTGGKITYIAFGSGKEPLIIIPGLSLRSIHGSALPLALMYRIFCRDYRVYVIDKKDVLPDPCTVSSLADDAAELMRLLGIGPAPVIGISQGGMIAQYLALDHPELVSALVLGVTLSRTNDTVRNAVQEWITSAEKGDYGAIVRSMAGKMYSESYVRRHGWLFPIIMKTARLDDPKRFITSAGSCLTCDAYERLNEIRCPVLVLGGKEDHIVTAEASEETAEKLRCEIYMYDGLGHSAYEEGKDFNKRILDFLKKQTISA